MTDTAAAVTAAPPKKRQRISKHKKKDQRKIDISAEVAAVQQVQDEIKLHGGKLEEKADQDLFVIDKGPMDTDEMAGKVRMSKKERYRNKRDMLEKILNPETNVKAVAKDRSHSNRAKLYQQRSLQRQHCGPVPKKLKSAKATGSYDLWDAEERKETFEEKLPKLVDAKGIGHGTKKYTKEKNQLTTKQQVANKSEGKRHQLETPHEGQSYQPAKASHQELLRDEHKKIVEEQEQQQKIDRKVRWNPETAATPATALAELQQGLFDKEDAEEGWETESGSEIDEVQPFHDGMPKTKAARNRYKADLEKQKAAKLEKLKRHREAQVYNAKRFLKEAAEVDADIQKRIDDREAKAKAKMPQFKTKYQIPDEELKLTSEIKPTLRELVPEGGILNDRYNSLLRRAIIEPHTVHRRKYMRKYKTKLKVKRSVKRALGEKIG